VAAEYEEPLLPAIRKAHKVHHKHLGKEDGECFGMLVVPFKYYKEAKKALAQQRAGRTASA
jgi:beta-carotene 3-hydroxylase